jgi:hypothetical protein
VQKTTLYTITNKRIVMRIGVALSATFNLPFTRIVSADMREDKNGNGDIALTLKPGDRLSWLVFWPHVRGFKKGALMPQMICLKDVAVAANVLSSALAVSRTPRIAERLASASPKQAGQVSSARQSKPRSKIMNALSRGIPENNRTPRAPRTTTGRFPRLPLALGLGLLAFSIAATAFG